MESLRRPSIASGLVSLRDLTAAKPFSSDKVSVRNIDLICNAGYDIWGREKPQRVLISVALSMADTFASAAQTDTVDASTVHYGHLSKSIISKVESQTQWLSATELLYLVLSAARAAPSSPTAIALIEAEIMFTKASRAGEGISLKLYHTPQSDLTTTVLTLHRARLLALIGVNSNERTMKQMIIVSIAVDRVKGHIAERGFEIEQIVEKTVNESSYETLESLAEDLATKIVKYFILANDNSTGSAEAAAGIRVTIEKPSAVPFADAPVIEIYRSAEQSDAWGKRMAAELGSKRPQIPFPLQGRLDEFLQSCKQD